MGKHLTKPITEKRSSGKLTDGFHWGATAMQGWRVSMQNDHTCRTSLGNHKTFGIFIVCDGYGGSACAAKTVKEFPDFLSTHDCFPKTSEREEYDPNQIRLAIINAFVDFDKTLMDTPNAETSGCTVTGVLTTPHHFFVFNLGDSRTIVQQHGTITFTTSDHKPYFHEEKKRIEGAGGKVFRMRVNGRLAISRALGNFAMKKNTDLDPGKQLVSPSPDVTIIDRTKDKDEVIAIFCNGISARMTNDEVMRFYNTRIPYKLRMRDLCEELVDYCCHKDNMSKDNMSVIMLKYDKEKQAFEFDKVNQDEEFDKKIRTWTTEYVDRAFQNGESAYGWQICFDKLNKLYRQSFFDKNELTQGYGIDLKKGVIFKEFDKLTTEIRDERRARAWEILSDPTNHNS